LKSILLLKMEKWVLLIARIHAETASAVHLIFC
jgi:hypothetical protein